MGLPILDLSKIVLYEFWYDSNKPKYKEKAEVCYMGRGSVIVYIKMDIYKDIAEEFEARFGTSNYELDRPIPKRKNKKVIGLMKDELGEKNHERIC